MMRLPHRRFGLSDALVLILATAIALAITRHWLPDVFSDFSVGGEAYRQNFINFMYRMTYLLYLISHFTATWTLAYLFLGLRRPRPVLGRLLRQPGAVACWTAAIILGLRLVNLVMPLAVYFVWQPDYVSLGWFEIVGLFEDSSELPLIPSQVGCGVFAAWILQAVAGCSRGTNMD